MPYTTQDLINQTLSLIDEPQNSNTGLFSADGISAVWSTPQTVVHYLNEATSEMCRSCFFYPVTGQQGTASTPPTTNNQQYYPLRYITDGTGATVWAATEVAFNGLPLVRTNYSQLRAAGSLPMTDAGGAPTSWYPSGDTIALYPVPTTAATIKATGPGIPTDLSYNLLNQPIVWLQDDMSIYLVQRAAIKMTIRNAPEDSILTGKVITWMKECLQSQTRFADKIISDDPYMFNRYFRGTLAAQQAEMSAQLAAEQGS